MPVLFRYGIMVLWEITLGTAYFLGLKRTYKLALRIQRRLVASKYPKIRQFLHRYYLILILLLYVFLYAISISFYWSATYVLNLIGWLILIIHLELCSSRIILVFMSPNFIFFMHCYGRLVVVFLFENERVASHGLVTQEHKVIYVHTYMNWRNRKCKQTTVEWWLSKHYI